ncbi:MAG: PKD domain-containing protein [Solirubrobacteraceae bacterium]
MRKLLLLLLLLLAALVVVLVGHPLTTHKARAQYRFSPTEPDAGSTATFVASPGSCQRQPCTYRWTATVLRSGAKVGDPRYVAVRAATGGGRTTDVLGRGPALKYRFSSAGTYAVQLTVIDGSGARLSTVERVVVSGRDLPHDPHFVGPSYYSKFSDGPPSSMSFFPIYTYQVNLGQWSELPARIAAMGVNGIDDAYSAPAPGDYALGGANGLHFNAIGKLTPSGAGAVTSYAMQDEPNQTGSPYAASACSPARDICAHGYEAVARSYHHGDPNRPVWGNFTKDVDEWSFPPPGWTAAQFSQHEKGLIGSLDIASADYYGWTDSFEWNQATGEGTGHYGAWVYGHTVQRLQGYNPSIPVYGFVECCNSTDGNGATKPTNEMMPGMLQSAVWNILVHGGRGYIYWTTNFRDSSSGGDPDAEPYPGATYQGAYALYGEHEWDAQYAAAQAVNREVKSFATDLNSPTVTGIESSSSAGVPVATLGKDAGGRLWLLAQADGNTMHPLSNTTPMKATITLPPAVPPGTVMDVVGEHRTVVVNAQHQISDTFSTTTETPFSGKPITYGYQHHIYVAR